MRRLHLIAFALLAAASPARALDLNVITAVEVKDEGGSVVVSVKGSKPPNFTTFSMADPPRFVIDLSESRFEGVAEDLPVGDGTIRVVKNLSYGSDATSIARVMIAFVAEVEPPDVQTVGEALVVRIAKAGGAAVAAAGADASDDARARAKAETRAREEARTQATAEAERAKAEGSARAGAEAKAHEEEAARAAAEAKARDEEVARAEADKEADKKGREAEARADADQKAREQAESEADAQAQAAAAKRAEVEAARLAEQTKAREEYEREQQAKVAASLSAERSRAGASEPAEPAEPAGEKLADEKLAPGEPAEPADAVAGAAPADEPAAEPVATRRVDRLTTAAPATTPAVAERLEAGPPSAQLREVGFRQLPGASRVFVRTSVTPRFTVQDVGENTIRVELENTRVARRNDTRFLDTSFFPTAVAMVTPSRRGSSYVVDIKLKERVPYQQRIEGDMLAIDFERPAAAGAPSPAPGAEAGPAGLDLGAGPGEPPADAPRE